MDSNDNNSDNNIEINNNNKNEIEFQEYYENKGNEEKLMISDGKNITNYQEIKTDNLENEPNEELIDNKEEYLNNNMNEINDNDKDNDSLEREEMENEYELVKALNEYKEQNKKLKAMNNYQKTKIESLENELEKVNNKFKLNELELNDIKSKAGNKNINNKDNNSNAIFMNQIYNLNSQLDKYKNLVNEKNQNINYF